MRLIGILKTAARSLAALSLAAFAGLAAAPALAAESAPVDTPHVQVQLVAAGAAQPGQTVWLALRMKTEDGWHTFWRNPGDAGEATRLTWTAPAGWSPGAFVWPAPKPLLVAGLLMNYVYEGEVLLPIPLAVPADARPGETVNLKADALYQVCADTCVPGEAQLSLDLPVAAAAAPDAKWAGPIQKTLDAAPKPAGLTAAFQPGAPLKLAVAGPALRGLDLRRAYFFPAENGLIDNPKPQAGVFGPDGLTLNLAPAEGAKPAQLAGVLAVGGKAFEISAAQGPPPPGVSGKGQVTQIALAGAETQAAAGAAPAQQNLSLWQAMAFAFLGGVILNLMPCVFPVLSMKAASIAGHAQHGEKARSQGLAFLAGVVASFLVLAGLLIAAQAAGAAVGWGFQLQSPPVIAALSILMLLVALNLAGLFEIGLSVQGAGSSLADRGGLAGSFFTGALAVVVAAPCTAPFMAGAMGFALAQPAIVALSVFLFLALGFALPFTALTFAPGLLRLLPRPGPWMGVFKTVLSFPMFATAAWLAWVFASQVGTSGLPYLFAAALLAAFGAWLFGMGQREYSIPARRVALQVALPLALVGSALLVAKGDRAEAEAEPWSAARVAELQAEHRPVFVNFTADWCVTCKVNEGAALSSAGVADALARTKTAYLKGDWTKRDAAIAAALAEHGRAGVPLYLVYPANGGPPQVLPQLLTAGIVKEALEKAAAAG